MKKFVPLLFTFILLNALYLPASGTSYRPPLTNAGTIYTSDIVVVGKSVGEPVVEQWLFAETSDDGEDIFVPQQMIVREFLVEEVLEGQSIEPNSIIRLNYVAPQGDEEKSYSSGSGEQVLLALQFDREAQRMGHGGFINTNPKIIKTEGTLDSSKAWVETIRSADSETINQLIKDEWREMGYNYPSGNNADHNIGEEEDDQAARHSDPYQHSDEENFAVSYEEAEVYDYEINGNPQYLRSPEDESVIADDNTLAKNELTTQVPHARSDPSNSKEKAIIGTQQAQSPPATSSMLFLLLGFIGLVCVTGLVCVALIIWKRSEASKTTRGNTNI